MSDEENFALASAGASIESVTHEALHVASAASNLLLESEDLLWITSDAPQSVTVRIAANHPPITFFGWHVWHDYLSNPKTVECASGVLPDCLNTVIVCNAVPGAGTQLWQLPQPIPPAHQFIRVTIQSTFAPGPSYMNNLCLFARHPGPRFTRNEAIASRNSSVSNIPPSRDPSRSYGQQPQAPAGVAGKSLTDPPRSSSAVDGLGEGTRRPSQVNIGPGPISSLLRDLDEDIKALHPIRTLSPTRNVIFPAPGASLPSIIDAEIGEYMAAARRSPSSGYQNQSAPPAPPLQGHGQVIPIAQDPLAVVDNTTFRLAALEQAVTSLTRALENQRQDIAGIKELISQQRRNQPQPRSVSPSRAKGPHQIDVNFPEEPLKAFIEDVLGPKLAKLAKRTEAKTLERLEQHVAGMLDNVADVVDRRVRGYMHHLHDDHGVGGRIASAGAARSAAAPASHHQQPSTSRRYTTDIEEELYLRMHDRANESTASASQRHATYDRPTHPRR